MTMTTRTLGTLTIGQAPRPDVTPILDAYLPASVRRIHRGLLDGMARSDIDGLFGVEPGDHVLVSRLLDGSAVQLSGPKIHRAIAAKLSQLEVEGCDVILLLCTGKFHGLRCERAWLVEPDLIIPPVAAAIIQDRLLGIVVPIASQMSSESGKWEGLQRRPIFAASSPYTDTLENLAAAGTDLTKRGAEGLLLDCMGFTERHRAALAAATGLPVILSNALMGKVVGELFSA
jgi:protein AroM